MAKLTGAQALVKSLEREGIDIVFGIPGNHSMPIFDALYQHPHIKSIVVRHEQGAAFMADGYARATGRIAAVLTLPGPGVTNAFTGLAEAYMDSSPVLLLSTQVNRASIDKQTGLLHELTHQFETVASIMKYSERVMKAEDIFGSVNRAMKNLRQGRPRPVQIEIPRDVQLETFEYSEEENEDPSVRPEEGRAPVEAIAAAVKALASAQRPLIMAGGGVISSGASDLLVRVAERLGAPVLTTGMGVGSIPSDHPLACGVCWAPAADIRPFVAASDAFLAVGTRFNEGMTHGWQLTLPEITIRIDVDGDEIERNLPIQHKLVGDARATLFQIEEQLAHMGLDRKSTIPPQLLKEREVYQAGLRRKVGFTYPWMNALRAALPRDAIISADMSLFWADMLGMFPVYYPRTILFPWGYGTLGFGIPAALGAKFAAPERPVVAIVGDGAFLFTGAELATAVQYGLNIPILVLDNQAYGMIKVQQRDQFNQHLAAVDLHSPDFIQLARAFGAYGELVTTPDQLSSAITTALIADKPTLLVIPWRWTWGYE